LNRHINSQRPKGKRQLKIERLYKPRSKKNCHYVANCGVNVFQLKRLGRWKSNTVAEGYVDSLMENKTKIATMLSQRAISVASSL